MEFNSRTYNKLSNNLLTTLINFSLWFIITLLSVLCINADEENAKSNNASHIFIKSKTDKALGEECLLPTECVRLPHVTCHLRHCNCEEGYKISTNNTCISDDIKHGFLKYFEGSPMIPIIIVLGIMFVGMCVALNLFSRARFRNSRSIFTNPQSLKLAKAQERRASQLSQLSGHQINGFRSPTNSFRSPRNSFSSPTHSYNHVMDQKRSPNKSPSNSTSSLQIHLKA